MKSLMSCSLVGLLALLSGCNEKTQLQVKKLGAGEGLVTGVLIHNGETPVTTSSLAIDCGTTCAVDTFLKYTYRLSAKSETGSKFKGWSGRDLRGGCTDGAADCEVLISWSHRPDTDNSPIVIEATFEPVFPSGLTVMKVGGGSGRVVSSPVGIDCGSTCLSPFPDGTMVTLTATADTGTVFAGWSGAGCSGTSTCTATVSGATVVTARFLKQPGTVLVSKTGTGSGTITSSPGGIDCGATCTAQFEQGSEVTLTATPAAGSSFASWAGACTGMGPCRLTIGEVNAAVATFTLATFPLTVQLSGSGSGRVTSSPAGVDCSTGDCTANFLAGAMVTLTAAASTGSNFTGWTGACSGTTSTCTLTMDAVKTVGATFAPTPLALTVTRTGTGAGTVTSMPAGVSCGATCTADFARGTMVTLTATADADSLFTGWSGACTGTASTCTVALMTASTVTANFDRRLVAISVSKMGAGAGIVTSSPAGLDCGLTCAANFPSGVPLTLTAMPDADSVFTGWSGGSCSGTGTCVVTPTAATTVVATFAPIDYAFSIIRGGAGSGTIISSPAGLTCGATCTARFRRGTVVTLTAAADNVSTFGGWSVPSCQGTGPCVVTVTGDTTVTASFSLNSYALTVSKNGAGNGTVTSNPTGVSCGTTCSASFPGGSMVTLTASPASDSSFAGWSGACTGMTPTCVVNVSAASTVQANFTLNSYTLTVNKAGTGNGTVSSLPAGISCGGTCSSTFLHGTTVTLTASQDASSTFAGWSGACTGTGTCTVTLAAASTVTATFTLNPNTLAVIKAGTGTGTVTSTPAGLSCGTTCSATFATGTMVTLSASASADSDFTGWSGGGCSGTGSCIVTLSASTSVTATFTLKSFALSVSRTGTGSGTVSSAPAGISCGTICSASFSAGTVVTLIPSASGTSSFAGWSGACTGTGTCTVTVDAAKSVTANFSLNTYALTVVKTGGGSGTVTSNPVGISCGATCGMNVPAGTTVTLSAVESSGSTFTGWSGGGCSGTGLCTTTVTAATTVSANFAIATYVLSVSKAGTGTGTVTSTPVGVSCGATCTASYAHGTAVVLTPAASADSDFAGWSGACTGTGPCVVTMSSAQSVTATFNLKSFALTVSKTGTGAGTVTSSPAGISCGATCSAAYPSGTSVTLTAVESSGSTFLGWSGGGCTGTGTCTVTMTAATSVSANFSLNTYSLSVAKTGTGSGTVTSSPPGITCGAACVAPFAHGTSVVLTAVQAPGSTFLGWSGAGCFGTGTCTVSMTAPAAVTATFALPNIAFVTSSVTTGAMGGLSGADTLCQQRAAVAGLPGTYRAWLSTSTVNAIDRISSASGWRRTDGLPFVNSPADLVAGRILYPLRLDEFGVDVFNVSTFTSTLGSGVLDGTVGSCEDWTSTTSQFPAGLGNTSATTSAWTTGGVANCASVQRVSCFGVDVRAVAQPIAPAQLRRAFVSTATWTPGGGIASADAVCASEAGAANLPGTYRALLTPLGATAASRFNTAAATWVRVDDVSLASSASTFFTAPFWQAALDVTAGGTHVVDTTWSGAANLANTGSMSDTCNGWTSASVNFSAGTGTTNFTEVRNAFGEVTSDVCNQPHRLLCLQE